EEFVRHKMLDLLGDLALVGRPLLAHIIAVKPSHTANCELARQIVAQLRKPLVAARTFAPPQMPPATAASASEAGELVEAVQNGGSLDVTQSRKTPPHRSPFPMVDCGTDIDGNNI